MPAKTASATEKSLASAQSAEIIDPPRIAVGAFTPILGLLLMEKMHVPVVLWVKPIAVVLFYFLSSSGVSAPAAHIITFGKIKGKNTSTN